MRHALQPGITACAALATAAVLATAPAAGAEPGAQGAEAGERQAPVRVHQPARAGASSRAARLQWRLIVLGSHQFAGMGVGLTWSGTDRPLARIDRASEFPGLANLGDPAAGKAAMLQVLVSF